MLNSIRFLTTIFLKKDILRGARITRKIQRGDIEVLLQTRFSSYGFVDLALSGRNVVVCLLVNIEAFDINNMSRVFVIDCDVVTAILH
jgi:hypothetical protein